MPICVRSRATVYVMWVFKSNIVVMDFDGASQAE